MKVFKLMLIAVVMIFAFGCSKSKNNGYGQYGNGQYGNGYSQYGNGFSQNGRFDQFGQYIPNNGYFSSTFVQTFQSGTSCSNGLTGAYFGSVFSCLPQTTIWEINANVAPRYSNGFVHYNGGTGSSCSGRNMGWSALAGGLLGYAVGGNGRSAAVGAGGGALICALN